MVYYFLFTPDVEGDSAFFWTQFTELTYINTISVVKGKFYEIDRI